MRYLKCFLLLFLSFPAYASAQSDVLHGLTQFDKQPEASLANAFFKQLDKEEFTDSLIQFAVGTHPDTLRQQVYYWAAEFFYDQQQYSAAEEYGLKALPFCQKGTNRAIEGDCLNLLSVIYIRLADYEKAAKYAKLCNEIDRQEGDPDKISSSLNTLAAIYMSARQPKEAEKYILKAIEYSQKANNTQRQAVILGMASEVYHALHDEQQAYDYACKAFEKEEALGRTDKALIREAQMSSALMGLERYSEAKNLLQKVIPAFRENGNRQSLGISCNRMGSVLLSEGKKEEAVPYFEEALGIFTENKDLYNEHFARNGLYRALKDTNPAASMQHLERCNELKDSIYDEETGELLSKYAALYDNEQLQAENEQERAAHRRTMMLGTLALLLILATAWYMVKRIQRRHQQHTQTLIREIEQLRRKLSEKPTEPTEKPTEPTETPTAPPTDLPAKEAEKVVEEKDDDDEIFLLRVIGAVNEVLPSGNFSVEQIASKLCMSTATFRRRLQGAAGETPKAYISAIQMEKAANLLTENPEMSLLEVAFKCGFDDRSNFGRAFKRIYGCSPLEYRNQPTAS